jgi:hypothetical protein
MASSKQPQIIDKIVQEYFDLVGVVDDGSKRLHVVRARNSISVALRGYFGVKEIGRAVGRSHTNICNHANTHEANLKFMPGYKAHFKKAQQVVSKYF